MNNKKLLPRHLYHHIFDVLMELSTKDLTISLKLLERIDEVANYCGDRAFGRKPDFKSYKKLNSNEHDKKIIKRSRRIVR